MLRTPSGRVWMIDAGGAATGFDVGENVVAPYLWSLPVTRLEGLLVTHAGGKSSVVRELPEPLGRTRVMAVKADIERFAADDGA